jgi:hypothetical protein
VIVENPITDGVCRGRVADVVVALRDRQLAGEDRGAKAVAVVEDLDQVAPVVVAQRRMTPSHTGWDPAGR